MPPTIGTHNYVLRSKSLAELYPSAKDMFADVVGLTAWSSVGKPSQVFVLLQNIYLMRFPSIVASSRLKLLAIATWQWLEYLSTEKTML
jgi:hypothetical protein